MRRLLLGLAFAVSIACSPAFAADTVSFDQAFGQVVLPVEGWYVFNPGDSGGETIRGISRHNFPKWSGWALVDAAKSTLPPMPKFGTKAYYAWVHELNASLKASQAFTAAVSKFYAGNFWNNYHLGELPSEFQPESEAIVDAMVNCGPIAARWVQQAMNRANGTHFKTPASLSAADIRRLTKTDAIRFSLAFLGYRFGRYDSLAVKDAQFEKEWLDREGALVIRMVHERDRILKLADDLQ